MEKRKQTPGIGMTLFAIVLIILLTATCVKLTHERHMHQKTQEKLEDCRALNQDYKQALLKNSHRIQVLMESPYIVKKPNSYLKKKEE